MTGSMGGESYTLEKENNELRQRLMKLREKNEALREENKFHEVKVAELMEIVVLKKDDVYEKLMSKSLQNAEMATQLDYLNMELKDATVFVQKLSEQRELNKRTLLEMAGIVKSLQSVKVDYTIDQKEKSYLGSQEISMRNVKKKVETIMSDRQMLVRRCKELEVINDEKDKKISALEVQFHLMNKKNSDPASQNSNQEEWSTSDHDNDTNGSAIASHSESDSTELLRKADTKEEGSSSGGTQLESEGSTSSFVRVTQLEREEELEEMQRLRQQLVDSTDKYDRFKDLCKTAFSRMSEIETELGMAKTDLTAVKSKNDEYRENLKDIIGQYKELHSEHSEDQRTMHDLSTTVEKLTGEMLVHTARAAEVLIEDGMAENVDDLIVAYKKAGEKIATLERKVQEAETTVEKTTKRQQSSDRKLRDAVATYKNLEQEKERLGVKVNEIECELTRTKLETQKHKVEAKQSRRQLTSYLKGKNFPNEILLCGQ